VEKYFFKVEQILLLFITIIYFFGAEVVSWSGAVFLKVKVEWSFVNLKWSGLFNNWSGAILNGTVFLKVEVERSFYKLKWNGLLKIEGVRFFKSWSGMV